MRLDRLVPGGYGDGDAVVAVHDEVQVPDAVHVDRRKGHAAPLREIQPLPSLPHPVGGGPELAVEVAPGVDGPGHGVELDGLQAKVVFATPAQGGDYLVKQQNAADVAGLAAQPASEPGEHLPPPGPVEVVFDIYPQQTGVKVHGYPPHVSPGPSESP